MISRVYNFLIFGLDVWFYLFPLKCFGALSAAERGRARAVCATDPGTCWGSVRGGRGETAPGLSFLPAVEMLLLLCATALLACVVSAVCV